MKASAVLLIDLENFFCSREDFCRKSLNPLYDRARFNDDLERLIAYARAMTAARGTVAELPFTVRRAYADFNAVRYVPGGPQHYLRQIPEEVLSQGVEPVQVFRLSRGGKNAADMKMAMDATTLLFTAGHVEHFVLVTGDADFIPVILELKRHGRAVSVIGVTGATSPKIQRFVDNFELFEDLLAAEEVEARTGDTAPAADGMGQVAVAIRSLLNRSHPLRFAAVKPLLSKELGHAFDPAAFGCDTTGDFLRKFYVELGVVVRAGTHDSEIDLPNGHAKDAPAPIAEKPAKAPGPEPHTAAHYKRLLSGTRGAGDGAGKVYGVPWSVVVWTCDAVVPLLAAPAGTPAHSVRLLQKLVEAADASVIRDVVKHVRLFYPTLRAGLPAPGADGTYSLPPDATGETIRRGVLRHVANVLRIRLAESGTTGEARAEQLAAVFDSGAAADEATREFAAALAETPPEPLAPKPAPTPAEDLHTAVGYVKLLKAGGEKGSETAIYKVLPVPWSSVERVCADAFDILSAAGAPLPREQLSARLIDAGKELSAEKYEQHVRRALGILRLAGDIVEDGSAVSLGADVVSGFDLRGRALAFLLQLLQLRLEERGEYDPIRAREFVAALDAGPLTEKLIEEVEPAIAWLYRPDDFPEDVPTAEAVPPDAPAGSPDARPESEPESAPPAPEARPADEPGIIDIGQISTDQSSGEFSAINMAVLTREAVAAAEIEAAPPTDAIVVEPLDPPTADALPAVPLADWLPDGDLSAIDLNAAARPVGSYDPLGLSAADVAPRTAARVPEVDMMKPPPLPRRTPPPLPVQSPRADGGASQEPPESA